MKKFIIISVIVILVIAGLAGLSMTFGKGFESVFNNGIAYPVRAEKIEKGSISSSISASGYIEEVEKSEVYVETPLKVSNLLVRINEEVTKGQKLMDLDMDNLKSELEKLRINRNVQELSINSPSAEAEIKRAEASINAAEQAVTDTKAKYENSKILYDAKAISKSELDMASKAVDEAQRALENAKLTYQAAISNRNMDKKIKEENLKATDLSIKDLEKRIEKLNESMLSPIDGVIVELNVQEGSFTSNMQPVFRISNTDTLRVKALVGEYDMKDVNAGQNVTITGEGIDREVSVSGKVESVSPVAKMNRTSGGEEIVVEVFISINKSEADLKPGLSVNCNIHTREKENVLVAPLNIIKEDKDGNKFAYIIDPEENTMVEKSIKFGVVSDMKAEVLEGLNEGDMVVLDPQPLHKAGLKVKVLETK